MLADRCSPCPYSAGSRRWWDRRSGSPPPHRRRAQSAPAGLRRRGRSPARPLHPKTAAGDFGVVTAVLVVDQFPQLTADVEGLPHLEFHRRLEVFARNPQAVDAANRGHHNHVAPFKQRTRRRVTQHVNLFVDRCRLGDGGVTDRYVGLRLVVVVIGDEILNSVVGENSLSSLQLRCQGFVVSQHQRRSAGLGDDIGHRERLTGARRPQQRLIALTVVDPLHELLDRRRLVALW